MRKPIYVALAVACDGGQDILGLWAGRRSWGLQLGRGDGADGAAGRVSFGDHDVVGVHGR